MTSDLPDSWADVDASAPEGLSDRVSPRDLQQAADRCETLFEVAREVRVTREMTRMALRRLGLLDELARADGREPRTMRAGDADAATAGGHSE